MPDAFHELLHRARAWAEQARGDGWLSEADVAALASVEHGTPADLFVDAQARPLVVALFGGTGVGKSSLLNRLADSAIARTGVERPTSREVTLYVHESVRLADLPAELPVESVQVQRHQAPAYRDVLWIDAPDIDSTAEANRRCALAWLPHVDLVCYVVDPERYRDDAGWRVLQARGHKHGWMFILNRWDEGAAEQLDDFRRLLADAGFVDPVLLPTCCLPGRKTPTPDELTRLQGLLGELRQAHVVRELTRLGHRARLAELRAALLAVQPRLGTPEVWERLTAELVGRWRSAAETIRQGAEWLLRSKAARFGARADTLWEQLRRWIGARAPAATEKSTEPPGAADIVLLGELTSGLWDEWAQEKLAACLNAAELAARRAGLAPGPLRARLDAAGDAAGMQVTQLLRDRVRSALSRPGHALARVLRRVTGFLMALLPLLAFVWIGWKAFYVYYRAGSPTEFLGLPFAVHSGVIVLLAWAAPFTLDRLLRPSLERVVLRALGEGLRAGLDALGADLEDALAQAGAAAAKRRDELEQLLTDVAALLIKPVDARAPALARLIAAGRESK